MIVFPILMLIVRMTVVIMGMFSVRVTVTVIVVLVGMGVPIMRVTVAMGVTVSVVMRVPMPVLLAVRMLLVSIDLEFRFQASPGVVQQAAKLQRLILMTRVEVPRILSRSGTQGFAQLKDWNPLLFINLCICGKLRRPSDQIRKFRLQFCRRLRLKGWGGLEHHHPPAQLIGKVFE